VRVFRRRFLAGLALGFVIIVGLALAGDVRQVGVHLQRFAWQLTPLVLTGTLFNYTLRFVKWHFYVRIMGATDFPAKESARVFVAGFPLALTPGKVGEALKAVWLQQRASIPFARGLPIVAAERISDGLAVLVLSTLGVITYPRYWPAFAGLAGLLIGVIFFTQARRPVLAVLERVERLHGMARFGPALREAYEGAYQLFRPLPTLAAVGLGAVAWLGEGLAFYLILIGLGVAPGMNLLVSAVFTLAFSTAIGGASALPGGLGAADATIAGMLTLLVGLPVSTAAAATLLIRFATLWFGVGLGLAAWALSPDLMGQTEPPARPSVAREELSS
jgi:glycosyltransferase 2 family protein